MNILVRIESSYFVAGIVIKHPKYNICAPIISYMRDWNIDHVKQYCIYKGWKYETYQEDSKNYSGTRSIFND